MTTCIKNGIDMRGSISANGPIDLGDSTGCIASFTLATLQGYSDTHPIRR